MRLQVRSLALSCGVGSDPVAVSCGAGSDPVVLWLWCRPAATAPIRPLAWEPPYAAGASQEMAKRQKKKKRLLQCYPTRNNKIGVPWWPSRLRIQCCHYSGTGLIPGAGTSACQECRKERKKRKGGNKEENKAGRHKLLF